jgi:hypothetical protein
VVDVGREIGIIVDTVSELLDISGDNIEPSPSMGASMDTSFILGIGKVEETVRAFLQYSVCDAGLVWHRRLAGGQRRRRAGRNLPPRVRGGGGATAVASEGSCAGWA